MFWSAIPISSEGRDDSFQNNVPDPATSGSKLPTFKFELEKSEGRVMGGSCGKEATVVQLPISKALAGVSMRMEPGVMRELHWYATAAEWAFVTEGLVGTTVIDQGCSETNDFGPGDVWYFPRGHGHVIETLGDRPCHFISSLITVIFPNSVPSASRIGWATLRDYWRRISAFPRRLLRGFQTPRYISPKAASRQLCPLSPYRAGRPHHLPTSTVCFLKSPMKHSAVASGGVSMVRSSRFPRR